MALSRRGHGEGSIHRTKDGSGWVAKVSLPRSSEGKRRVKKRRARTKAEAIRALQEMKAEVSSPRVAVDQKRTVVDVVDDYLAERRNEGVAVSSLQRDERFARLVKGYFGHQRLVSVTVLDIDRFLADVAIGATERSRREVKETVGRDHLRRLRGFLRLAIRNDIRRGMIDSNVADFANLPANHGRKDVKRAIPLEELAALLSASSGTTRTLIDMIGRHGLRPAEARAVMWDCIDFDGGTIRVKAQISATNELAKVKTERAHRVLPLHPELIAWLERLQALDEGHGLVSSTESGRPVDRNNFNRSLRKLCRELEIGIVRPYELRHTAITHQCERHYQAWQVADWAGTSEKMIYLHYRHLITELVDIAPVDWA